MVLKLTGQDSLMYKILERGFIETHINKKFKFNVVNTENIKADYREAIKKTVDIQKIDEADLLICFEETPQGTEEPAQDNSGDNGGQEDNQQSNDDQKDNTADQKEDKDKVNESDDNKDSDDSSKDKTQDDNNDDNTDDDNDGTTVEDSKLREKIINTVARCLYVADKKDIEFFDVNYKDIKTFFVKVNIQK